jgi:hypothetical protein
LRSLLFALSKDLVKPRRRSTPVMGKEKNREWPSLKRVLTKIRRVV